MGLFGFGKKKEPQPVQQPKQAPPAPVMSDAVSSYLSRINSGSDASPSVKPTTPKVYTETVSSFLNRNPEAKQFTLTGRPDDLASYDVGDRCHVEEDEGKYYVTVGGIIIGRLPSSAVKYGESVAGDPQDLSVVISSIEYDIEKERDIITVYVA